MQSCVLLNAYRARNLDEETYQRSGDGPRHVCRTFLHPNLRQNGTQTFWTRMGVSYHGKQTVNNDADARSLKTRGKRACLHDSQKAGGIWWRQMTPFPVSMSTRRKQELSSVSDESVVWCSVKTSRPRSPVNLHESPDAPNADW